MGSASDKAKGYANEAVGNIKQGVGKLTGSESLKAKGLAQEAKGEGQQAMGKAKSAMKENL